MRVSDSELDFECHKVLGTILNLNK